MKLKCNDGKVRSFLVVHEGVTGFMEEPECLECGAKFEIHDLYILKPLFRKHVCEVTPPPPDAAPSPVRFTGRYRSRDMTSAAQGVSNAVKGILDQNDKMRDELAALRAQNAALVATLRTIQDQAHRATMVQDRSVGIIKQVCGVIASSAKDALAATEPKQ